MSPAETSSDPPSKRRRPYRRLRLAAGVLLLAAFLGYLYFGDTGIRQARRLRTVRDHLPAMSRHLTLESKYAKVKAVAYTGRGGSMMLVGTVATVDDYENLIRYAESLCAPVTLVYRVTLPDGTHPEEIGPDHRE